MTTLRDLSRHLGLSVTQVSRALNGHSDVSEATRERVAEAAKALNYMPNVAARRLVSGRSGLVGLVARGVSGIAADTIFFETVTGLSAQFSERGLQFVLHLTPAAVDPDSADIVPVYERLARGGALDGFVIIDPRAGDRRIRYLQDQGVPFVVHGRTLADPAYPFVDIDNHALARQLTGHLIAQWHRRIALISGPETLGYARFRLAGYREALEEAGLRPMPELVAHGPMTESLGLVATIRMFNDPATAPTGIICGNILIAKGVYQALEALSQRVPADVSVVAHDDGIPRGRPETFYPALTVTRSALSDAWPPLAAALLGAIEGKPLAETQTLLPFRFVEHDSVAPTWS